MASLNDIPKKKFFDVPEDYFEKLPGKVQARTAGLDQHHAAPRLRLALAYALPVLIILSVIYFFSPASLSAEDILATVGTQEMIDYLQESALTTEEVVDAFDWSAEDLEAMEKDIYDAALPDADTVNLDL